MHLGGVLAGDVNDSDVDGDNDFRHKQVVETFLCCLATITGFNANERRQVERDDDTDTANELPLRATPAAAAKQRQLETRRPPFPEDRTYNDENLQRRHKIEIGSSMIHS